MWFACAVVHVLVRLGQNMPDFDEVQGRYWTSEEDMALLRRWGPRGPAD